MKKIIWAWLVLAVALATTVLVFAGRGQQIETALNNKIAILQKELSALEQKLDATTKSNQRALLSLQEVANRQAAVEKSQDELLTAAVMKSAPGVVSVVISKDVPKLEITYQNPFGDDPFFGDFGFKIPVYRQRGVEHKQVGAGTGFLIDRRGYILTNKHVVDDNQADYTALLSSGEQKSARVIYKDTTHDVAILKIADGNYPPVTLGNSDTLRLGQTVVAIGNALGEYNNTVSVGIISGLNRSIQASSGNRVETLSGVIQTDAAINPGNSGGPLLDLNGAAVGINVATALGASNISFAIPINTVEAIISRAIGI